MSDTRTRWILELVEMVTGPSKNVALAASGASKEVAGLQGHLNEVKTASKGATSSISAHFNNLRNTGANAFSKLRGRASNSFSSIKQTGISAFTEIRNVGMAKLDELGEFFPVLGRMAKFLLSPVGIIAGAILLVGGALYKGTTEAKAFNSQFLELQQLNLDKPAAEIDRLNDKILDTAFKTGLAAKDTAKAYFDIQSATGKYGKEVDSIVAKVGQFSIVTKTNLDAAINGTAKAINAFKLQARDMDAFLASSFKTVQVGVTTFDQLAQVQTDYAGAAAAAGQGFDDANKLFASFTTTAKSVNEAATLTKTAFQDLTKANTLKGFKGIGVDIFDKDGAMRSLDAIVRDAVPVLSKLNDQDFAKLKENIGGSEGIKALLDKMKSSGQKMIQDFDTFNNTEFNLDKAIKNANGDLTILQSILSNKVNNLFLRLGQSIMPTIVRGVGGLIEWLDKGFTSMKALYDQSALFRDILGLVFGTVRAVFFFLQKGWEVISGVASAVFSLVTDLFGLDLDVGAAMFGTMEFYYQVFRAYVDRIRSIIGNLMDAMLFAINRQWDEAKKSLDAATKDIKKELSLEVIKKEVAGDLSRKNNEFAGPDSEGAAAGGQDGSGADGSGASPEISGGGSGRGSRTITMTLDIKNYFSVDGSVNVEDIADQVVGRITDRLRDSLVLVG